jgi:hypothetical protein
MSRDEALELNDCEPSEAVRRFRDIVGHLE